MEAWFHQCLHLCFWIEDSALVSFLGREGGKEPSKLQVVGSCVREENT